MRNLVLMFLVGLAAFALLSTAADAAPIKLTKQQVHTVCDGGKYCTRECGLNGDQLCELKCDKKDTCSGSCLSCGVKARVLFPGLYSNRVVRQTVRQAQ
jgi:phage-related protein